mmetsp:Transcript_91643/g.285103  ORF Transcript_91643/g.285103 Transcript_91643/m.285103 type:complete len:425 (-) Transcript_91643:455-1729(-)
MHVGMAQVAQCIASVCVGLLGCLPLLGFALGLRLAILLLGVLLSPLLLLLLPGSFPSCRAAALDLHPAPVGVAVRDLHGATQVALVGDCLEDGEVLADRQVHEAVLVVVAARVGHMLRGDAAAPARHNPGRGVDEVIHRCRVRILGPDLCHRVPLHVHVLGVPVACDDDVNLMVPGELLPVLCAPIGRKMRHDHAPLSGGLGHKLGEPSLLIFPEVLEPLLARVCARGWPALALAGCPRRGVRPTNVVRRPLAEGQGVPDIRVHEIIVHGEVLILHSHGPIQRRRYPTSGVGLRLAPRVADRLRPGHVESPATPVVVPQHAQPHLAIEALAGVDVLEDLLELVHVVALVHRGASPGVHLREVPPGAVVLDPAPVEVVADVQDVVRLARGRLGAHLVAHGELAVVVDRVHEPVALVPTVVQVGNR